MVASDVDAEMLREYSHVARGRAGMGVHGSGAPGCCSVSKCPRQLHIRPWQP